MGDGEGSGFEYSIGHTFSSKIPLMGIQDVNCACTVHNWSGVPLALGNQMKV